MYKYIKLITLGTNSIRKNTMNFKQLINKVPKEIYMYISEFHPVVKENMNHVVKELQEYHMKVLEYEAQELHDSLLDDWELHEHLSLNLPVLSNPYILRNRYYDCI